MKNFLDRLLAQAGLEVSQTSQRPSPSTRSAQPNQPPVGSTKRPVGHMDLLLDNLRKRGLRCASIMDVGANRGNWSRMAKKIYPQAQFTLIEPQVEMKPHLERFCADFPASNYYMAGAGARKGTLTLTIWDDLQGSSILPKHDEKLRTLGKQRDIEIIAIDDLIRERACPIPDLMKLDVQGFELEALRGASSTFGQTTAYILEVSFFSFIEGTPTFYDVVDFMKRKDYVAYDFGGFLRRPFDGALGQCDICFVHEKGTLRSSNAWS